METLLGRYAPKFSFIYLLIFDSLHYFRFINHFDSLDELISKSRFIFNMFQHRSHKCIAFEITAYLLKVLLHFVMRAISTESGHRR